MRYYPDEYHQVMRGPLVNGFATLIDDEGASVYALCSCVGGDGTCTDTPCLQCRGKGPHELVIRAGALRCEREGCTWQRPLEWPRGAHAMGS